MAKILGALVAIIISNNAVAGKIYEKFPKEVNANEKYVFYSHGYIVEGDNSKPVDKRFGWGMYDFPSIKEALSDEEYNLVAFHRAKNTEPFEHAEKLSQQVRKLVKHGVPVENITLVGFSRGAFITGVASYKLSDLGVNTVLLAGCGRMVFKSSKDLQVFGHMLSIYEKTDKANTCKALKEKSPGVKSFSEIEINTGLSHGAFYRPLDVWVEPVKEWVKSR
ncbi:MAG: hypothetical protein OQK04_01120 [Kangiellaceae bacterium]|nr:hypothetical protein [Kangiellaceae bacterium]MCW8997302.1 hypothetical protein [Kangiellaceae bacterium]